MTATYVQAVDSILGLFNTAWQGSSAIVGSVPVVYWPGIELPGVPQADDYWCQIILNTISEKQSTLRIGLAPDDKARYTGKGLVEVVVYCPMSDADSVTKGRDLATIVRDGFRGKHTDNGVWFRDSQIDHINPLLECHRFSIMAIYEYDDIG